MACGRMIGPFECCSVVCCDCLEAMKQLPDGCVDAVVTDPPYSEATARGGRTRNDNVFGGDSFIPFSISAEQIDAAVREMARVVRRWIVASMEWRHVAQLEGNTPPQVKFIRAGAWVKTNCAPQFTGDRPSQGWEMVAILHSRSSLMRWNGGGSRAVWQTSVAINNGHPTPKPLELLEQWVEEFTDSGEIILDPFAGSGTTLVAAKKLGRHYLGFEISETYCKIARDRLARIEAQPTLFAAQAEQLTLGSEG